MKTMKYLHLFFIAILFVACQSEPGDEKKSNQEETDTSGLADSTAMMDSVVQDSSVAKEVVPIDVRDSDGYEDDDAAEKIVKANKNQLSFCDCVKKMNKLEADMEDAEGDAFEKLFDEMDRMQKEECAILLVSPNRTPEERAAHKRKVDKCLNN